MSRNSGTPRKAHQRTRILLVDDHPLVRERLAEIINRETDLHVCGEAEDRHQALEAVCEKHPDLAIIDLTLKNSDGLELIKDIHSRWPALLMLVVSMHDESLYAERVIRAGARGYITKQEASRNILLAIRRVLEGNIFLNEKIATQIISRLTAHPGAVGATPAELLADRELQVFELTGSRAQHPPDRQPPPHRRQNRRNLPRPHPGEAQAQRSRGTPPVGHLLGPQRLTRSIGVPPHPVRRNPTPGNSLRLTDTSPAIMLACSPSVAG